MIVVNREALSKDARMLFDSMKLLDDYNLDINKLLADLKEEFDFFYKKAIKSQNRLTFNKFFDSTKRVIDLINYIESTYEIDRDKKSSN